MLCVFDAERHKRVSAISVPVARSFFSHFAVVTSIRFLCCETYARTYTLTLNKWPVYVEIPKTQPYLLLFNDR